MRKFLIILGILTLMGGVVIWQHAFFLTQYAHFFTIKNGTKGADALVMLGGNLFTRMPYAVQLHKEGYAKELLITDESKRMVAEEFKDMVKRPADRAKRILKIMKADVPYRVVPSLKGGATSTFDEAYDLLKFSQEHNLKHLILVTDAFHSRRALYAFEKVLDGSGIRVEAMGAPNILFDESNWWTVDLGITTYVLEGIKYLVYRFTDRNVGFVKNV